MRLGLDKFVEEKWRKKWETDGVFEADPDPKKKSILVTVPYPYMNGPLHIGHGFTSVRVDAYARYKRMQGYNVLFPWAWHWTGQPIVAAADRLSKGDPAMVREFVEIDHIPKDELHKFYDPKYMAQYYTDSGREALTRFGLSIDWRREFHTTDLEPTYNRFILWQYNKLRQKGFVTRGTHPVVWCPKDESPTGDHDRLLGEGVTCEEFTLILFDLSDERGKPTSRLPAATFRPETIFGVTNLWVNPSSTYAEVAVNDKERWIISKVAALKFRDQLKKIDFVREFAGRELIGRTVLHPLEPGKSLLVLPANFVDPSSGSGVVYSVPAHAPVDYAALRDLQSDSRKIKEFDLNEDQVGKIVPISMIRVQGMGEFPAKEEVERLKIKDQSDSNLLLATAEIYRKEFHQGTLKENCGVYYTKKVAEVKPLIIQALKEKNVADFMYELPEKVVCRCTTECIVKVLEDQWFLKYSDSAWKRLAHECVDLASVYPDSARQWFHDVIDWLRDWPCARRVGLGTPLSWSPGWIVETLSDSTIYMCFYTIISPIRKLNIQAESLTDEFFDYVFLGEGDSSLVSGVTGIQIESLRSIREEFLYWYPVRLRNSAKELIPNHLSFFVFHHGAFFPRELWPKGLSANGMVTIEGTKISKSKGNVISLREALDQYGADALRAALIGGAEGMDDLDWREKYSKEVKVRVDSFPSFVMSSLAESRDVTSRESRQLDLWLESQVQRRISNVISALEAMKTKSAFQEAFYNYWNTIRHYINRSSHRSGRLLQYSLNTWIRLLTPFIPFTCEELNSSIGVQELISFASFPVVDLSKIHVEAELAETIIERLKSDVQNILKLIRRKLSKLYVYVSPEWKYGLFKAEVESREIGAKMDEILEKFFSQAPSIPKKTVADTLPRISKTINELGDEFVMIFLHSKEVIDEKRIYGEAKEYLEAELGLEVIILSATDPTIFDPKGKSRFALPFKPALYLE